MHPKMPPTSPPNVLSNRGQKLNPAGNSNPGAPNVRIAMPEPDKLPEKSQSLEQRIAFVEECVANSQHMFNKLEKQCGPARNIYVGPEYMFDKTSQGKRNSESIRQLTEPEYRQVDTAMRQLSKQFPDIIIKPGTVSWQKPVERPTTLEGYLASKGASDPTHPLHERYKTRFSQKNFSELPHRLDKATTANQVAQTKYPTGDIPDIDRSLTHLARNTADTYWQGERISHHHKITNFKEVVGMAPGQKVQHYAGKEATSQHVLPGNTSATQEICLDHALNTTPTAGSAHFIHSAWTGPHHNRDKYRDNTEFVVHASIYDKAPDNTQEKIQDVARIEPNGKFVSLDPITTNGSVSVYDLQHSSIRASEQLHPKVDNTSFAGILGEMEDTPTKTSRRKSDDGCVVS